ncbi:MAG: hypothetical protein GY822_26540 [Deltaproteobacteria bacterium]|nr:hypothetical protein [Deltaproteobacteria bacterium]
MFFQRRVQLTPAFLFVLFALQSAASFAGSEKSEKPKEELLDVIIEVRPKMDKACSAKAFHVAVAKSIPLRTRKSQRTFDEVDNLKTPLRLKAGFYDVLVSCPVRKGIVRTSSRIKVGSKNIRKRVQLTPTRAVAEVRDGGDALSKTVVFFDANGREVQRGQSQVLLDVPVGKLSVAVLVDDKKLRRKGFRLVGSLNMKTRPKRRNEGILDISPGFLIVQAKNNGRKTTALGAVRAPSDSERLVEFTTGEKIELPAGRYDVVTQLDDAHDVHEHLTRKIQIHPSKTTKVTSKHQTGNARLLVQFNEHVFGYKKETPANLKLKTELFLDAAPVSFNEVELEEELVLAPGSYRVRLSLVGKKLDDGNGVFVEKKFKIRAGRTLSVNLLLSQQMLMVQTLVGETPFSMWVELQDAKNLSSIARKKSDAEGRLQFSVRARNVVVVATLNDGKDTFKAKERTRLTPGAPVELALLVDVGRALVQVYEGEMAVRAKVHFFREGAGEPLKIARSGQSVFLPPGRYHLQAHRKGKRWAFPVVVVTSERLMERQLVLSDATLVSDDDDDDD